MKLNEKSFSLVELLISTFIGIVALVILGFLYIANLQSTGALQVHADLEQNARRAITRLASELKRGRNTNIPALPDNDQITVNHALYDQGGGVCTTHDLSLAPIVVNCTSDTDCLNTCGTGTCYTYGDSPVGICEKQYQYAIAVNNGVPQLVATAAGEPAQILGNNIQSITFEDSGITGDLRAGEVRMQLTTQGASALEKDRIRQATLQTVVHVRN